MTLLGRFVELYWWHCRWWSWPSRGKTSFLWRAMSGHWLCCSPSGSVTSKHLETMSVVARCYRDRQLAAAKWDQNFPRRKLAILQLFSGQTNLIITFTRKIARRESPLEKTGGRGETLFEWKCNLGHWTLEGRDKIGPLGYDKLKWMNN